MCVLVCRVGPRPLLAANRDEAYARPYSPPRPWLAATPFWAPRDEDEGGTWIGVNARGLLAGITNLSREEERPGLASRGHLVSGALARGDLAAARDWLLAEAARAPRNPCQIYLAQDAAAAVVTVRPEGAAARELARGVFVLSNLHDLGEIDLGLDEQAEWDAIRPVLADASPRLPRGYAVCKRAGWRGTVASALIEPGRRFLFAAGPPDEVDYEPVPGYPSAHSG